MNEIRFWTKVDIREPGECWPWKAAMAGGQGIFRVGHTMTSARRVAWTLANGQEPPSGIEIFTTCNTSSCCNPAHLFLATLEGRFHRGFTMGDSDKCWEWQAARSKAGYGVIRYQGKNILAHRLSWEFAYGSIPDKECILHQCDNPACVNPNHLFIGVQVDNMRDASRKGRMSHGESHYRSILTPRDIKIIRFQLSIGIPSTVIARTFGVHRGTIQNIKHHRTWNHIP